MKETKTKNKKAFPTLTFSLAFRAASCCFLFLEGLLGVASFRRAARGNFAVEETRDA